MHLSERLEKPVISHEQAVLSLIPPAPDSRCLVATSRQIPLTEPPPEASSSVAREYLLPEAREGRSRPAQRPAGEALTVFPLSASLRVRRTEKRGIGDTLNRQRWVPCTGGAGLLLADYNHCQKLAGRYAQGSTFWLRLVMQNNCHELSFCGKPSVNFLGISAPIWFKRNMKFFRYLMKVSCDKVIDFSKIKKHTGHILEHF